MQIAYAEYVLNPLDLEWFTILSWVKRLFLHVYFFWILSCVSLSPVSVPQANSTPLEHWNTKTFLSKYLLYGLFFDLLNNNNNLLDSAAVGQIIINVQFEASVISSEFSMCWYSVAGLLFFCSY